MEEIPDELPGRCTDITTQKKNSNRVSLFVDDTFIGGFYRDVVEKAGIRKGVHITPECYELLLREEQSITLQEQVYRWLGMRNHSSGELRKKALIKGYSGDDITKVLEMTKAKGYIDDALFARQFAEEKSRTKTWGPVKIRAALSQKGIKKLYIDAALDGLFDDDSVLHDLFTASRAVKKNVLKTENGIKRKKKLVDFLIRRGFPAHLVFEKSDDLLKKLEHEET